MPTKIALSVEIVWTALSEHRSPARRLQETVLSGFPRTGTRIRRRVPTGTALFGRQFPKTDDACFVFRLWARQFVAAELKTAVTAVRILSNRTPPRNRSFKTSTGGSTRQRHSDNGLRTTATPFCRYKMPCGSGFIISTEFRRGLLKTVRYCFPYSHV